MQPAHYRGAGSHQRRGGHRIHPTWQRLDQAVQEDRRRYLAYRGRVCDHRWRGGGAGSRWHDRFFRLAKRVEGEIDEDRDGRFRSSLSQRPCLPLRTAKPAEAKAAATRRPKLRTYQANSLIERSSASRRVRKEAKRARHMLDVAQRFGIDQKAPRGGIGEHRH